VTTRKPNDCPELGELRADEWGDVFMVCPKCKFVQVLEKGATLDHVVLAEIHHIEYQPAATEPGA
jgi:hypothetical protein